MKKVFSSLKTIKSFIVCPPGLENTLKTEMENSKFLKIPKSTLQKGMVEGGIEIMSTAEELYLANLTLQVASRVLVRIGKFKASNFSQLVLNCRQLPWSEYVKSGSKLALRVTCKESKLYHRGAVEERIVSVIREIVKDFTASSLSDDVGDEIVNDDNEEATQIIVVRLYKDFCTVSIDSTGTHLHKRGYRLLSTVAPLRENLAASMIVHSGWDKKSTLIDPFCGSGTIPIEAAMMAHGIVPGKFRTSFSFMNWPSFDANKWETVNKKTNRRNIDSTIEPLIFGSDILKDAINISQKNAEKAGVSNYIKFNHSALVNFSPIFQKEIRKIETNNNISPSPGWIISNLPFGKRISDTDIIKLYSSIGKVLKENFRSWNVLFMVSAYNDNVVQHMGIAFDEKETKTISNGGITVKLKKGTVE
jgi:putative N6-adenine-specific DNA methylase